MASSPPRFSLGDKVYIYVEPIEFRRLQKNPLKWSPDMEKCIGQVGMVIKMQDAGYVEVFEILFLSILISVLI